MAARINEIGHHESGRSGCSATIVRQVWYLTCRISSLAPFATLGHTFRRTSQHTFGHFLCRPTRSLGIFISDFGRTRRKSGWLPAANQVQALQRPRAYKTVAATACSHSKRAASAWAKANFPSPLSPVSNKACGRPRASPRSCCQRDSCQG